METVSLVPFYSFLNLFILIPPAQLNEKKGGKFLPFPISKLKLCISIAVFTVKSKDGNCTCRGGEKYYTSTLSLL